MTASTTTTRQFQTRTSDVRGTVRTVGQTLTIKATAVVRGVTLTVRTRDIYCGLYTPEEAVGIIERETSFTTINRADGRATTDAQRRAIVRALAEWVPALHAAAVAP